MAKASLTHITPVLTIPGQAQQQPQQQQANGVARDMRLPSFKAVGHLVDKDHEMEPSQSELATGATTPVLQAPASAAQPQPQLQAQPNGQSQPAASQPLSDSAALPAGQFSKVVKPAGTTKPVALSAKDVELLPVPFEPAKPASSASSTSPSPAGTLGRTASYLSATKSSAAKKNSVSGDDGAAAVAMGSIQRTAATPRNSIVETSATALSLKQLGLLAGPEPKVRARVYCVPLVFHLT